MTDLLKEPDFKTWTWAKRKVALVYVDHDVAMTIVRLMCVRRWHDANGRERFIGAVRDCANAVAATGDFVGILIAHPASTPITDRRVDWVLEYDPAKHLP